MKPIEGNDLKYRVTSTGAFSWSEHQWDVTFVCGGKSCKMTKRNLEGGAYALTCDQKNMGCKPLSDGSWIFLLDSAFFGHGRLEVIVNEYIPDADFDPNANFPTLDGFRNEVDKQFLTPIYSK